MRKIGYYQPGERDKLTNVRAEQVTFILDKEDMNGRPIEVRVKHHGEHVSITTTGVPERIIVRSNVSNCIEVTTEEVK